jgi:hypothetical protein
MEVKKYKLKVDKPASIPEPYKNHCLYKKKVKEIDLSIVRPQRAGIILYTKQNDVFYFGLGVDTLTQEYTDFGGGISYKTDKDVVAGALREFHEETLKMFTLNDDDVQDSLALYNLNNLIIFKYISDDMITISKKFALLYKKHVKHGCRPEVCNIVWLSMNEFKEQIGTRNNLFHRIQSFLQKAGNFYWLL